MAEYQPGVCNINNNERKKRKIMGGASFLNSMLLTTILFIFPSFTPLLVGILILNFTGFLGFLQSKQHFCAGLALKQKFNLGSSEEKVTDSEDVARDRRKAASIIIQSLLGSVILTTIVYLAVANF